MQEIVEKIEIIVKGNSNKIQFTAKRDKTAELQKAVLLLLPSGWQLQKYTEKQVFHETISAEKLEEKIIELLEKDFTQMQAFSKQFIYSIRVTAKGKVLFNRKAQTDQAQNAQPQTSHNRKKNYLFPEGVVVEPLVDMGIFTTDGKIINSMYDKYKQINRFVELVDDALKQEQGKVLHIVDFGCGKSYLTFILYYYFTEIKKIEVYMTGLDLKADVVEKCNIAAQKYGYKNLHFEVGNIEGYAPSKKPDMVISLHACDTATDFALYHGIQWDAKYIFSVPCCQHEMNAQMQADALPIFTRYGLVQERVSALMTDAIRANLLQACGYKTQLVEFVGFEHTPKNILVRAVKSNIAFAHKQKMMQEVASFNSMFATTPTLLSLLSPILAEQGLCI